MTSFSGLAQFNSPVAAAARTGPGHQSTTLNFVVIRACYWGRLDQASGPSVQDLNFVLVILVQTQSIATAGGAWPVQVQSSNFSPGICPSRSPAYCPEWVTLYYLRLEGLVSLINCQLEVACVLEPGTTSSSNYQIPKENCIWVCTITVAAVFALLRRCKSNREYNGWNTSGSI